MRPGMCPNLVQRWVGGVVVILTRGGTKTFFLQRWKFSSTLIHSATPVPTRTLARVGGDEEGRRRRTTEKDDEEGAMSA
jgi:hypothetical protein